MLPVPSPPAYRNPGWFLALPALLVAVLLVWVAQRADPRHQIPRRVVLVVLPGEDPEALPPAQQQALCLLLKDVLEMNGDLSVTQSPTLPGPGDKIPGREGWAVAITGYRMGPNLELRAWVGPLGQLPPAAPPLVRSGPAVPAQVMAEVLARLTSVALKEDRPGILVPRSPEAFWPLLEGLADSQPAQSEEALARVARCAAGAPNCATVAILRGQIQAFRAVKRMAPSFECLDRAREAYEAALQQAPNHPRASYLLARLLADTGRMKEALHRARQLSHAHPHTAPSYQALAYVGRNAGLLNLVEAGAKGTEEILLDRRYPGRLQLGLLYLGRWDAFEATLWSQRGESFEPVVLFHRAYLELLRGRRAQALGYFRQLQTEGGDYPRYLKLGEIFRQILEGQTEVARKQLRALDEEMEGLRVADGEFTFTLAEAYALLGDRDAAVDLAGRALAQGFACTRWYQESPLVAPLKGAPRWEALLQTLHERQTRLEGQFPVSDFPA